MAVLLFFFLKTFTYLFIFGCDGSSLLLRLFFLQRVGAPLQLPCGLFSLHGFSCSRARAPGAQVSIVVALRLSSIGSVLMAHRLSCSETCGIFPDQGSNPCLQHRQVDSLPLSHQRSPDGIISFTVSCRVLTWCLG